jgi:hypothetical protein
MGPSLIATQAHSVQQSIQSIQRQMDCSDEPACSRLVCDLRDAAQPEAARNGEAGSIPCCHERGTHRRRVRDHPLHARNSCIIWYDRVLPDNTRYSIRQLAHLSLSLGLWVGP